MPPLPITNTSRPECVFNQRIRGEPFKMSGADEDMWGDEEDEAGLANMTDEQMQVMSLK